MPAQFFRDIADIMAGRPTADEDVEAERLESAWLRRPKPDVRGSATWDLPCGTVIAIASPALRSHLRSARTTISRH